MRVSDPGRLSAELDARSVLLCVAMLALLTLPGCGTLPRLDDLEDTPRLERVQVVDKGGSMMPQYRESIDQALDGMAGESFEARHAKILEVVNGAQASPGNHSRILIDGPQTWQAIFDAIATARDHIHIESYIFENLEFGQRLSDLLAERRRAGVSVRIIYDSLGSVSTPKEFFQNLNSIGIVLCEFNPINPLAGKLLRLNHRDHRKVVIVDGKVAFTGGINFHSVYRTGSAMRFKIKMPTVEEGWRDTHVELRGTSVHDLQRLFLNSWRKQGCSEQPVSDYFPIVQNDGPHSVAIVGSSPDGMLSRMYLLLTAGITYSTRSVWLTTAYFAPDPNTINALTAAAKRGVDVRLLLPGFTDSSLAFHAGRSHYEKLLRAGVKIYEQREVLLHAKTVVIDGVWSSIGSSNVDWRSFCHNDEINAVFVGSNFGEQMGKLFEDDLNQAHQVTLEEWQVRSAVLRLREWISRQIDYLL
jgi:cardiolipin synthase A/B